MLRRWLRTGHGNKIYCLNYSHIRIHKINNNANYLNMFFFHFMVENPKKSQNLMENHENCFNSTKSLKKYLFAKYRIYAIRNESSKLENYD